MQITSVFRAVASIGLLLGCAVIIGACGIGLSEHPLSETGDEALARKLLGTWEFTDDDGVVHHLRVGRAPGDQGDLELVSVGWDGEQVVVHRLPFRPTVIGARKYMSIDLGRWSRSPRKVNTESEPSEGEPSESHTAARWIPIRYVIADGALELEPLDEALLRAAIDAGELSGRYQATGFSLGRLFAPPPDDAAAAKDEAEEQYVIVTATTEAWRDWIRGPGKAAFKPSPDQSPGRLRWLRGPD